MGSYMGTSKQGYHPQKARKLCPSFQWRLRREVNRHIVPAEY